MAAAGCKSQKLIAVETEVAAARARLETLEKKRRDLLDETKRVALSQKTYAQQADEAEVAKARLVAAGLVLHGDPVPDGVLLEEALKSKSPELGKLAANIVQRQLPCLSADEPGDAEPTDDERYGDDCGPPELPDECEGVLERTVQSLDWSCPSIVKTPGARPVAVCFASGTWRTAEWPLGVPTAQIDSEMVRLTLEHKGRLFVADWPAPSLDVYRPPNDLELAQCRSRNDSAHCTRTCEERSGRLDDVCRRYYDAPEDDEYDPEEDPDVAAARRASEQADAEAARAREELEYQQCLAACDAEADTSEPEAPITARLELRKERLPGVFAFDVSYDTSAPDAGPLPKDVLVLGFDDALTEVVEPESQGDTVDALDELLLVKSLSRFDAPDGVVLFGPDSRGAPAGVVVAADGRGIPRVLTPHELCALLPAAKRGPVDAACAALPPLAPPDAGAPDAGAVTDGGAP